MVRGGRMRTSALPGVRRARRSRRPATCATARTRTSEAALYAEVGGPGVLGGAKVLQGKEMSFNNWLDVDAAYALGVGAARERGGDREAQQPVRCGVGRHACRGVRESVRVRPGLGVRRDRGVPRRRATSTPPPRWPTCSPRSWSRRPSRPTRWRRSLDRQNLRVVRAPLGTGDGLDVRPIPGGALVQDRDLVDRDAAGDGRSSRRASRPSRSGRDLRSPGRWRGG